MQKITKLKIKIIAKEVVKLSKKNTPIQHSNILEIISQALGYRDYNALSNNVKNENTLIPNSKDEYTVSEVSKSDKSLEAIRTMVKKLETEKDILSNDEIQKLENELKVQRLNFSRTVQYEDTLKRKKLEKKKLILTEKAQYEEALEKFNIHYFSVLEVLSRSQGYKDYYSFRNSLKKEVPLVSENMDDDIESQLYKANQILRVVNTIKEKLASEKKTLSHNEIQKLKKELKILSHLHTKVLNKYQILKKELGVCPNCKGQGTFSITESASVHDMMWYEDGEYFTLSDKECFWCSGTGKASSQRIKQREKMQKESPKNKIFQ